MVLVVLALFILVPVGAAQPTATMLDLADLSNIDPAAGGKCESFNASAPGAWGGEPSNAVVAAFPGEDDDAGYCTLNTGGMFARHIELRVLDGIADDSFDVYVKNPGGNWALVYTYGPDPSTTEVWKLHHIYGFPAGKGQGETVEIKIEPTNAGWSGFGIYGQLAVDYVKIFDH